MNGLSNKRKQIIGRIVESTIDSSQGLVDDIVREEGAGAKTTLVGLYTDMVWEELYNDRVDAGGEIGDQEANILEPVIKKALCNLSSKIGKMIHESMGQQKATTRR